MSGSSWRHGISETRAPCALRSSNNLSFRFYGPFEVLQRVETVAYKLDLPAHAQVHAVVHVSQLKKHVPPTAEVSADLPSVCTDPDEVLLPMAVLERAMVSKGGATAAHVKVR